MQSDATSHIIFAVIAIVIFVGTAMVSLLALPGCGLFT